MEAYPETLGTDEDGRKFGSLVLRRCHGTKAKEVDLRLNLALKIIAENQGKVPLSMNALAEEMARRYATEDLTDGESEKAKEAMRSYLRKEARDQLAAYAHKAGKAKNAQWEFEDRRKD